MKTFSLTTKKQIQMIDMTPAVKKVVAEAGVGEGLCTVFIPHTTAGVTVNENADPDVQRDMLMEISKIVPFEDGYKHAEGNSSAHLKSTLFGCSANIIVSDGQLCLGTWQSIFFCEFDGPRERNVRVQVTGT